MRIDTPMVSVVVPVYGCSQALEQLVTRVRRVFGEIEKTFEIVLVDDCSPDDSWSSIVRLAAVHSEVRAIKLSRNFGQHIAIMAGLREARGKEIVVMDCDLQDPPEMIPDLLGALEVQSVAIAVRLGQHQPVMRRVQARLFHGIFVASTGVRLTRELTSFAAMRRRVVEQYIQFSEPDQHFLHVLSWLGFETCEIPYQRPRRMIGKSSYTFRRRLRHALQGLLFETSRALYITASAGLIVALIGFGGVLFVLVRALGGDSLLGWPSTISAITFFGGFSILTQSVVGMYIAKTFQQTKNRPLFVVSESVN